jgi:hypothetical protein
LEQLLIKTSDYIFTPHFFRSSNNIDAGVAQLVERNLAKVDVAGSSPVSRSTNPAKPVFFSLFYD